MPAQMSTRKIPVENVFFEALCDIDAEPQEAVAAETFLFGSVQETYLLSLLTPEQQHVAKLLGQGFRPIEIARMKGTRRLATHRMIKRIRARLRPYYSPRLYRPKTGL